jgi:hypothetical protein
MAGCCELAARNHAAATPPRLNDSFRVKTRQIYCFAHYDHLRRNLVARAGIGELPSS